MQGRDSKSRARKRNNVEIAKRIPLNVNKTSYEETANVSEPDDVDVQNDVNAEYMYAVQHNNSPSITTPSMPYVFPTCTPPQPNHYYYTPPPSPYTWPKSSNGINSFI